MKNPLANDACRRPFLARTAAMAAAPLLGVSKLSRAEPPPEVTTIRLFDGPFLCFAPQYLAEELLYLEGFRKVEYLKIESDTGPADQFGDIEIWGGPSILPSLDSGAPLVVISGLHAGCWELFASDRVQAIRDVKGKSIAIAAKQSVEHIWLSSILAYVGLRQYPVATKRALRAMLKAADLCAAQPEMVAKFMVTKGYEPRYDVALEVIRSLPYNRWRIDDPASTLTFYALRLREVGMISSTPQKIIETGTDWRILNQLKRELKV